MNRLLSALLLFCLGLAVPLAATPLRVCLLDHRLLIGGLDECQSDSEGGKLPCCPDCEHHGRKGKPVDCCIDVDPLPQIQKPALPAPLPPLTAIDLPPPVFVLPVLCESTPATCWISGPIRGPDPWPPHRSVLGVWRL